MVMTRSRGAIGAPLEVAKPAASRIHLAPSRSTGTATPMIKFPNLLLQRLYTFGSLEAAPTAASGSA